MTDLVRCPWCGDDPLYVKYHDEEWGVPNHDDRRLFEKIILEGMQAGLSWITILRKRENFRVAFDHFDAEKVARYDEAKIEELMQNAGIIRNRLKIESAISNARVYLKMRDRGQTLDDFLWSFVDHKPQINHLRSLADYVAETDTSKAMSKALKKEGFRFVGSTTCYAMMQSVGMVNDHLVTCWRHPDNA